jgi:hypothetical protein
LGWRLHENRIPHGGGEMNQKEESRVRGCLSGTAATD